MLLLLLRYHLKQMIYYFFVCLLLGHIVYFVEGNRIQKRFLGGWGEGWWWSTYCLLINIIFMNHDSLLLAAACLPWWWWFWYSFVVFVVCPSAVFWVVFYNTFFSQMQPAYADDLRLRIHIYMFVGNACDYWKIEWLIPSICFLILFLCCWGFICLTCFSFLSLFACFWHVFAMLWWRQWQQRWWWCRCCCCSLGFMWNTI